MQWDFLQQKIEGFQGQIDLVNRLTDKYMMQQKNEAIK